MERDRIRWDERHRDHGTVTAAAPDLVRECPVLLDTVPSGGRALDLACGPGAVALWLAARDFEVTALDVSPVAIDLLNDAARAGGLTDRIAARVHDVDTGIPVDLDSFAVIVCQRFRDVTLYQPLIERLADGGVLLLTVLSVVGLQGAPGAFHAPAGELADAYASADVEILCHHEGAGVASIAVRRLTRP